MHFLAGSNDEKENWVLEKVDGVSILALKRRLTVYPGVWDN